MEKIKQLAKKHYAEIEQVKNIYLRLSKLEKFDKKQLSQCTASVFNRLAIKHLAEYKAVRES